MMREREWGDFQTPPGLTALVLEAVWRRHEWGRILEPTCGRGNFLVEACRRAGEGIELKGIEVQPHYVAEARGQLSSLSCDVEVSQASIFDVDSAALKWSNARPILVVGNPPWITNAELSSLASSNVPTKSNFKGLSGYSAQTGSANFDIAEFILLKLIRELEGQVGTIAFLCKRLVARNALEYASFAGLRIDNAAVYAVDAAQWFQAAVDACLFVCDIGAVEPRYLAEAFASLRDEAPYAHMRVVSGHLVEDFATYESAAGVEGRCPLEWRQGIKHDVSAVAELKRDDHGVFRNGFGEPADVEAEWVFPLLKSSDLFHGRPAAQRRVVVTQRSLGTDTACLTDSAPKLWQYLTEYEEAFAARKSVIYSNRPRFAMFGIGPYTFAPYKVAISGMYKVPVFRAIGPTDGAPVMVDDTCYFLPFADPLDAAIVSGLLNSEITQAFLRAVTMRGAKRPITKRVLQRVDLSEVARRMDSGQFRDEVRCTFARLTEEETTVDSVADRLGELEKEWLATG